MMDGQRSFDGDVVVVGFGYWAPNIVRALVRVLGAQRVRVVDTILARQAAAAEQFPGIRVGGDLDAQLADPAVRAVFLCTPSATHHGLGLRALQAGKHLFAEKPLVTRGAHADELHHVARANGLVVFPGHVYLHTPFFAALQRVVAERRLGELRFVEARRYHHGPRAREDVSAAWDVTIHDVYILDALLGVAPVRVSARGGAYLRAGVDDAVFAILEYPDGLLVSLFGSWYGPEKVRALLVVGSDAMLEYREGEADPMRIHRKGFAPHQGLDAKGNADLRHFDHGVERVALPVMEEPLVTEVSRFLDACAQPGDAAAMRDHVLRVTRTLEAIERSAREEGRPILLKEFVP